MEVISVWKLLLAGHLLVAGVEKPEVEDLIGRELSTQEVEFITDKETLLDLEDLMNSGIEVERVLCMVRR